MLNITQKAKRYDILMNSLQIKLDRIQENLASDLDCDIEKIPQFDLEKAIDEHIKCYAQDIFYETDEAYYLIDTIICERTHLLPTAIIQKEFKNSLK